MKYLIYKNTGDIVAVIQPKTNINNLMPQYTDCSYITLTNEIPKGELRNKKVDLDTLEVVNKVSQAEFEADQAVNSNRNKRNALLTQSDWVELPSNTARFTTEENAQWVSYRQALRDLNMQDPIWPVKPI